MTTPTLASAPFWSRSWQRLKDIAEAMGYDHAQYTVDRMAWLQAELVDVKVRVAPAISRSQYGSSRSKYAAKKSMNALTRNGKYRVLG